MKKLLNTILGYKLLVIIPSQLLQIIESCIVLITLGFIYPGWVYKYVFYLNSLKNKVVNSIREEAENENLQRFEEFEEEMEGHRRMLARHTQEQLARRRALEPNPGIRIGTHGPGLRQQFRPILETHRMEIMDFGTETADDQRTLIEIQNGIYNGGPLIEVPNPRPEVYGTNYQLHLVGEEPQSKESQNW